jgi:hypothetical protein
LQEIVFLSMFTIVNNMAVSFVLVVFGELTTKK